MHTALTLAKARECLAEAEPDVILLDIMLPDGNGFDFCEELQDKTSAYIDDVDLGLQPKQFLLLLLLVHNEGKLVSTE